MTENISILIITYNRPDDLMDLLQSLKAQQIASSALREILILNNASTVQYNEAEKFITENADLKINYILSKENLGVSRGRNKLMSLAKGDYLLVLDDDVILPTSHDLQNVLQSFKKSLFKEANTGIITFRIIYHETGELQQTAFPHKQFDQYKNKQLFLTSYFTGCVHLLKKNVIQDTGLYPEDFFYGMEEYDLSYRAIKAGYSLGYDSSVTFRHKESPKGRQPNHQKLSSQWVNKSKVAWRYLPAIFYFTTMFAWSIEYLRKDKTHWATYFTSWKKVLSIPLTERRSFIGKKPMTYLRLVKARLWY